MSLAPAVVPLEALTEQMEAILGNGGRLGLLTARPTSDGFRLVALTLQPRTYAAELWETPLPSDRYPSLTLHFPQAHWFERDIHDFFGILPEGHPRFKSLLLHEAWPAGYHPLRDGALPGDEGPRQEYEFMEVRGEGVYEIPVGPIHAGIIEPGHFRFSCLGEIIENLEIRLGYQHRGIERRLTEVPWRRTRFVAESASSDTAVGNALAHATAVESLLGIEPSRRSQWLRAVALEIERLACHLGDLGGICGDIGFAGGSATFSRMRGAALGLGERLTGTRLQTAYVRPGGVTRDLSPALRDEILAQVDATGREFERAVLLLVDNPAALDRMEHTGVVRPSLARHFGLVGPAGRASGCDFDVRLAYPREPYTTFPWYVASAEEGDVLSRVQVRADEVRSSLLLIYGLLDRLPEGCCEMPLPDVLPADAVGLGIVEAWRGELIHLIFTDGTGRISRYCIKDPSFNNWTGLAIAARGQLVADFPLCNKSFGLSYSGNDL